MEKQGKIKVVRYNNEDLTTKHIVVVNDEMYISYIESYEGVKLVQSNNMPQWLLNKIRANKVINNDNVIITVNDDGETLLENDEAILELPKKYSKAIEELFEERYTKEQIKEILIRVEPVFYNSYRGGATASERKEVLEKIFDILKLPKD